MPARMDRSPPRFSRRHLLKAGLAWLACLPLARLTSCAPAPPATVPTPVATRATPPRTPTPTPGLHEARHYRSLPDGRVACGVCFRRCLVEEGKLGFCHNKKNVDGRYYSLVYGRAAALQVDPIEKEPAFHMYPGIHIFCLGTASCNNRCRFCQNWFLSQQTLWQVASEEVPPAEVVRRAQEAGCEGVSFTYNEPTVFYEYMLDVATLAREAGLHALFHTNGSMNREPLEDLLRVMEAVTVDLKAFDEEFYRQVCRSELQPVLRTLEAIRASGRHLEVVNLVIPTLNDDPDTIAKMCQWIARNLGPDVPLHFLRFFPAYKLQRLPATPVETLEEAAAAADAAGLEYVYIGNLPGHARNSTRCPACGTLLIGRVHFAVMEVHLDGGRCPSCGRAIPGLWAA
ncbi:MAG: AmmeMemoRadiSam system radical SAM enzyme [Anaerolineae bacterium]|nr:AmmeMemoRadiSam system radical SAM enzyme [Anaerolineae bacterium]